MTDGQRPLLSRRQNTDVRKSVILNPGAKKYYLESTWDWKEGGRTYFKTFSFLFLYTRGYLEISNALHHKQVYLHLIDTVTV